MGLPILLLLFLFTEYVYYLPLIPLSLDRGGSTRLPPAADGSVRLLFVGDILLGDSSERLLYHRGFDHPFAATRHLIRGADLAVGNLEGPVTVTACPSSQKKWSYRMPPLAAAALREVGFDLMDLANNHIQDRGDVGIRETRAILRAAGLLSFGAGQTPAEAHRPAIVRVRGVKVAFLGYVSPRMWIEGRSYEMRSLACAKGRGGAAWGSLDLMARDISSARSRADVVVVSIHMGGRYREQPTPFDRKLCHRAIDAGADAVVGHGTHIMGPVEIRRGRPILYGVGNFAFGSVNLFARFSLMAFLEIDPRTRRIRRLDVLPIYTMNLNPWVAFQSKVLVGFQARQVLGRLLELSRSPKEGRGRLVLESDPPRVSARLGEPRDKTWGP